MKRIALAVCMLVAGASTPDAWAYVGPGLGAGMVAAVIGIAAGILMLIVGVVWYPLKRMIRRIRAGK